ncbi:ABC transporter permease [Acetobacteraceae bacterium ESL0709]|nr:ABC transporter permease [Acetobacteraceae bacterium ESL0697]MDF7678207.1 ABC transporter permease [Acetobacteraceae bacterium ESL0709]
MTFPDRFLLVQRSLAAFGRVARSQPRFMLIMIGAAWGVVREAIQPVTWRRSVQIEFWRNLRQMTGGGLVSVLVVAVLTGFGIVAQAVYWLGFAGMAQMTGSILSTVLVREIAPVLVGIILLGRSGMLIVTDLGNITLQKQLRVLNGQGIDPFIALLLPRSLAMTVSGFTLGMVFSLIALTMGYFVCWMKNIVTMPIWSFMFQVISSVHPEDYISIPLKFLLSGFAVGLSCCLSGMDITSEDDLTTILPKGFSRGIMSVMAINVALDVIF